MATCLANHLSAYSIGDLILDNDSLKAFSAIPIGFFDTSAFNQYITLFYDKLG